MAITSETVQIETFEQVEVTDAMKAEPDADTLALCESLGLSGQTKMFSKSDDGEKVVRFPFREMTKAEFNVYVALCPEKKKVEEYEGSPIPRRVLELVKTVRDTSYLNRCEVWSAESAEVKDPVLVGVRGLNSYSEKYYILARWGAELLPFEQLSEKAKQIVGRNVKDAVKAIREECNRLDVLITAGAVDVSWKVPELRGVDRAW